MNVTWWAIDPTTSARVALPDVGAWSLSPIANAPGALSLDYPTIGRNYATLSQYVTEKRDLEVEIWFEGTQTGSLRGILCERASDLVAEARVVAFSGHFLEWRMGKIVVAPVVANPKQESIFSGVSPGTVMATLMLRAQARGVATDITYSTFTATSDSNGAAWDTTVTANYSPVTTTYAQVLDELVERGACEWDITGAHQLRLFKPGTRGLDRTVGATPTVLRRGRNLTEVPTKVSSRETGTDLWVAGGEGLFQLRFDASARAVKGRQDEVAYSANNVTDVGALNAVATTQLGAVTVGAREVTHGILFGAGDPLPLTGFHVGDYVYSNPGDSSAVAGGGNERLRIAQWSLSRSTAGEYTGTISLNDLFDEQLVRIARRLARLQSGSTVVGTSTSSPGVDDGKVPAAPVGLVASSVAYQLATGAATFSAVTVSWSAVTTNSDGTAIFDLSGYRVQFAYSGAGGSNFREVTGEQGTTGTTFTFSDVNPGVGILIRVAAFDTFGNQGAWSTPLAHTTTKDLTAPPVPSTPTARNFLRQLIVEWDGLGSAGEVMPLDFSHVEVHASTASNFTPTSATLFERLFAKGGVVYDPGSYTGAFFFKLISVDLTGNKSVASAQATATPSRAVANDIGDLIITAAKLADQQPLGPKIASAQISTPHLTVATFSDNLLLNGGFEDTTIGGTAAASWTVGANSGGTHTFTRDTTAVNVRSGAASARLGMSAASGTFEIFSDTIPTKPGDNWFFEFSAKASRALNCLYVLVAVGDTDPAGTAFYSLINAGPLTTTFPVSPQGLNFTVPATVGAGVVPKYIRLFFKTGLVTGDAAALTVWVDEIRARKTVGTAEIQDAAISRAKIGLLQVGDGQFESASVGKLLTGTLTATVTLSGIIRTATSGARSEMDAAGIRLYNTAGTNTVDLKTLDGSALVTGTYRSSLSGERINMLPDGTMRFYASTGSGFSEFANLAGQIAWRGFLDVNSRSGRYTVGSEGASMHFATAAEATPPFNLRSEVAIFDRYAKIIAPLIELKVDGRRTAPDGFENRVLMKFSDSAGADITTTTVHLINIGGNPTVVAPSVGGSGSGFKFIPSAFNIVNGAGNAFGPINASLFTTMPSTAADKEAIADARAVLDPLATIKASRARMYVVSKEKWHYPPPTAEDRNPAPVAVTPRIHIGVLVDELPDVLRVDTFAADGITPASGVSLGAQTGVLWGAIGQILDQRLIRAAATITPPAALATPNVNITVTVPWDGGTTQTVPALVSVVPVGPGPLQQRAITVTVGALTTTGVTVTFRSKRALTGLSALDPDDRYVVNALFEFTPPYQAPGAG